MKLLSLYFHLLMATVLTVAALHSSAADGKQLLELKRAGISDDTIALVVKEKVIETCAFTVEELVALKKGGIGEETLQVIVSNGSYLTRRSPRRYGNELRSIRMTTLGDIVRLKKEGFSEETIRAVIVYSSQSADSEQRRRAWKMLQQMGLVVDQR